MMYSIITQTKVQPSKCLLENYALDKINSNGIIWRLVKLNLACMYICQTDDYLVYITTKKGFCNADNCHHYHLNSIYSP